jgi:DNA invertase Pin-like site-specific DNA recombinase
VNGYVEKARTQGKKWGGRRLGTRVRVTEEKEALILRLHRAGKVVTAIARAAGVTRKTVYQY